MQASQHRIHSSMRYLESAQDPLSQGEEKYETEMEVQQFPKQDSSLGNRLDMSQLAAIDNVEELQNRIVEFARRNQVLVEKTAILENELLLSRLKDQPKNSQADATNLSNNIAEQSASESQSMHLQKQQQQQQFVRQEKQVQSALLEKLRLEEMVEFMREESARQVEELQESNRINQRLEFELKDRMMQFVQATSQMSIAQTHGKRIEEQLKLANINFVNAQKKITSLEKESKDSAEKLFLVEQEKKKISQKWAAASSKVKSEEKLRVRIRELEVELLERQTECEEYKRKYVNTNTELRVFKEGEFNYKDLVELRIKELRDKQGDETKELEDLRKFRDDALKQREELVKQNTDLLGQLEEFAVELTSQQTNLEGLRSVNAEIEAAKAQTQQDCLNLESEVVSLKEIVSQLQEELDKLKSMPAIVVPPPQVKQSLIVQDDLGREQLTKRLLLANAQIQRDEVTIRNLEMERVELQRQIQILIEKQQQERYQQSQVGQGESGSRTDFSREEENLFEEVQTIKYIEGLHAADQKEVLESEEYKQLVGLISSKIAAGENKESNDFAEVVESLENLVSKKIANVSSSKALYDRLLVKYFYLQKKLQNHMDEGNQSDEFMTSEVLSRFKDKPAQGYAKKMNSGSNSQNYMNSQYVNNSQSLYSKTFSNYSDMLRGMGSPAVESSGTRVLMANSTVNGAAKTLNARSSGNDLSGCVAAGEDVLVEGANSRLLSEILSNNRENNQLSKNVNAQPEVQYSFGYNATKISSTKSSSSFSNNSDSFYSGKSRGEATQQQQSSCSGVDRTHNVRNKSKENCKRVGNLRTSSINANLKEINCYTSLCEGVNTSAALQGGVSNEIGGNARKLPTDEYSYAKNAIRRNSQSYAEKNICNNRKSQQQTLTGSFKSVNQNAF